MYRLIILFLLLTNPLTGQIDSLDIVTKTSNGVFFRTLPIEDGLLSCWVKKRKNVMVLGYKAWSNMWHVRARECEGYVPSKFLVITSRMTKHQRYIDGVAKRAKMKRQKLEYERKIAIRDSISKVRDSISKIKESEEEKKRKARIAAGYTPPIKSKNSIYGRSTSSKSSSTYSRYSSSRSYFRGPRGGCYYINSNGNKTYVERSLCGTSVRSSYTRSSSYHKGSRGGCYRYTSGGKKKYVSRSLCN